ncbi:MAG: PHP domain-containing protein [Pseudomonadales bacterium]|nr:PHP domain-containing protein [Pseudomonadales bacterium]
MKVDLHTHTTASDGLLDPVDLVRKATDDGVQLLAITDHDTLEGYHAAVDAAQQHDLRLISGVEFSSFWLAYSVHVVGLNFDANHPAITAGVEFQQAQRWLRAKKIAQWLADQGINNAERGALRYSNNCAPGRPHFARFMVEQQIVPDIKTAFKRYLGAGKMGDLSEGWASLPTVIDWIHQAGGTAVLAHPTQNKKMKWKQIRRLARVFKDAGGDAIELITNDQVPADISRRVDKLAIDYEMLASGGSDYHGAGTGELGRIIELPIGCKAVWFDWD